MTVDTEIREVVDLELDHIFILVSPGAPEADRLTGRGFREGEPNVHPGQGTANRRFFFENFMLELLWVQDRAEAQSERTKPSHIWERWRNRHHGSPFGLVFRHPAGGPGFPTRPYVPAYLPSGLSFLVGENGDRDMEPLVFVMPDLSLGEIPSRKDETFGQGLIRNPVHGKIVSVQMQMPLREEPSVVLLQAEKSSIIGFFQGERHELVLGWSGGNQGSQISFQPELPLRFVG